MVNNLPFIAQFVKYKTATILQYYQLVVKSLALRGQNVNELESILVQALSVRAPNAVGNPYLVLGIVQLNAWRKGLVGFVPFNTVEDNNMRPRCGDNGVIRSWERTGRGRFSK